MAYTISNAKDDLAGIVHGTNLNDVTNLLGVFRQAADKMLLRCDPDGTRRITNLSTTVHDEIYEYSLPADLKGRKVIDIRPHADRGRDDNFTLRQSEAFELRKTVIDDTINIKHNDGTKSLRLSKNVTPAPVTLHEFDSTTANGTTAIVATASGLTTTTLFKVSGAGSTEFDIAASGDGIQITGMSEVDLTDHDEISELFFRFYMDDVSNLTSVTVIWGIDLTTNYWTGVAQTAQADGTAFRNGWNIIKIPWNTATESGTVTPANIDSLKATFATTGAISNVRVDLLTSSIGEIFEIEYYSSYLFRTSSGTWIETPTADTDIVNLDSDARPIFLNECKYLIAQQVQGEDGAADKADVRAELNGIPGQLGQYAKYKKDHPSDAMQTRQVYYEV